MRFLLLSTLLLSSVAFALEQSDSAMDHSVHMQHEMMPTQTMVMPVIMPVMEMETTHEEETHVTETHDSVMPVLEMPKMSPAPLVEMMEDTTTWHGMDAHHSAVPSTEAFEHINHTLHEAMNIEYSGNADIDFLRSMIPHHQGALDMADVEKQFGKDGTVKTFANKVKRDQVKEIRWMRILLQTLEYENASNRSINEASIEANRMVNMNMHQNMAVEFTGSADIDFMTGMIPHHEGAVAMAEVVLEHGKDKRVKDLARGIINAQTSEITTMKIWLSRLKWRSQFWRA